ncbi:flexible cuticle protein 12-like [Coccinella septempunctata]|uniref:flexible cuticle protein 12-like n=1 Tax=Coccinella septempunctata TaxID=41139 RepID=UPI001D073B67|nr:flexible cuticle protein 12-like [Coccinella septempunctata]
MFKFLLLTVFSTTVLAVYLPNIKDEANSQIISYDYRVLDDGYTFEYTTSNGITRQETGHIKVVTDPDTRELDEIMDVEGLYSYTGDDGKFYRVTYTSNENGYVPQVSTSASRSSDNIVVIGQSKPNRPAKEPARNQYTFPYKKITNKTPKARLSNKRRY